MNVVDVGANVGYYTLMFVQVVGTAGHIIAIEPSPENLPELKLNIERNKLRNVEIIPKAVGDTQKVVALRSGINSGVVRDDTASYSVEQDLIDNIITEPIDFMKIDIEGYEGFALEGAQRILSEYRPTVFLEIHPLELKQYGCGVSPIINRLSRIYDNVDDVRGEEYIRVLQKGLFLLRRDKLDAGNWRSGGLREPLRDG